MNKVFKIVYNRARDKMMIVNEKTSSVQSGKKAAVTVAVTAALSVFASGASATTNEWMDKTFESLNGTNGSAIYIQVNSKGTVTNSKFNNNTATVYGGAIFSDGELMVEDSTFENNVAGLVGGAIATTTGSVKTTIAGNSFKNNHSVYDGGAIGSYNGMTITNSYFEGNTAQLNKNEAGEWVVAVEDNAAIGGGAISLGAVSNTQMASIEGTTFKANVSGKDGGAIATRKAAHANNSEATLKIEATFEGNEAYANGGAIYNTFYAGDKGVEVAGNFTANKAGKDGGAIYNDGAVDKAGNKGGIMTIASSTFAGNSAGRYGGAIFSDGELMVEDSTFENNVAGLVGGAIATTTGSVKTTIAGNSFKNNHSVYDGGAIGSYNGMTITNSYFEGNTAQLNKNEADEWVVVVEDNTAIGGGAISLGAVSKTQVASIEGTIFKANVSGKDGGAIATRKAAHANNSEATLKIEATFEGNEAYANGGAIYNTFYAGDKGVEVAGNFTANKAGKDGGAIYNDGAVDKAGNKGGVMTIANSTFVGNTAGEKGGAIYNTGTLTLEGVNTFKDNTAKGNANDIYNTGLIKVEGTTMLYGGLISLDASTTFSSRATPTQVGVDLGEGAFLGLGGTSSINTLSGASGSTVHFMSTDVEIQENKIDGVNVTTTGDVTDQLGGNTNEVLRMAGLDGEGEGSLGTMTMEEGRVVGKTTVSSDGTVTGGGVSKIVETSEQIATDTTFMLGRMLANDVRKRMGDLRSGEGNHGAWARYDGGRMSGDNQLENDFNTIQVGIDTVPVVGAPRMGVAFSYTKGDADFVSGSSESEAFSLAAYGTYFAENGAFVDVIGRMATVDTDMTIVNSNTAYKGSMDNVLLSLSGEVGYRFDVTSMFFVEPQAELTYTYLNSSNYSLGDAQYELDDTNSLVGRIGFAAGMKCPSEKGDLYVRASAVHEFLGDSTLVASIGDTVREMEADGKDTWVEFGLGGQWNINKATHIWADVERTSGATVDEDWRATVGVRYNF